MAQVLRTLPRDKLETWLDVLMEKQPKFNGS